MCSRLNMYPVAERRLRPIYDWLDSGNNKKALQEAEKVIKKQPSLQCAKVLKCLALIRLGKEIESLELLETIKKESIIEEAALQLMSVCYREVNKLHLVCELYELAIVKDPGNEEILNNLFLSYVRVADFKKQTSTAMSLYKVKPKNQYYFWAIISLLIQTTDNLADLMPYFVIPTYYHKEYSNKPPEIENSKDTFLRLAEKMVEKHANEKKIETDQEVLIYLVILEMQGKLKEALSILNGDLGNKLEYSTVKTKRIDLLLKLELWAEANELLTSVVREEMDSWNYILFYLDTVFKLGRGQFYNPENESCPFVKAKGFLEELAKENKGSNYRKRGPLLALLEFYSRLISEGLTTEKLSGAIFNCMIEYVEEFGTKEACLHDLRPYLHLVDFLQFLTEVCKLVSLKSGEYPKSKAQMNLHLTNAELCKVCGVRDLLPNPESIRSIDNMMHYFVHCLKFNTGLLPTEPRSNDRYALLAAYSLYDLWVESDNTDYLFEAITLCSYALLHSPSNSQLRTLLLKFYHLLGGTEGAHKAYLDLDLKHMQLDTLGYLHIFPLLANAEYYHAKAVLNNTLKFFSHNFKESVDHITFAYKYESLTKIPEFIHIRDKLNFSTHYRQATIEKMLLDIFSAPNHSVTQQAIVEMLPIDKIEWGHLQDNRDFTVLWDIEPAERRLNPSIIQQTYFLDIVFLRLRSILLEICASCVQLGLPDSELALDSENIDRNSPVSNYISLKMELSKITADLESNMKALKKNTPNSIPNRCISGPPKSRLVLFIQCNYFDPIIHQLKYLLCLLPGDNSSKEDANSNLNSVILFFKEFTNVVSNELNNCNKPSSRNLVVQMCALFVEIASFSCIVAGVCDSILKKFKQALAKKNKKKKESQRIIENQNDFDWRADVIGKYINSVSSYIKYMETVLKSEEKNWREFNTKMGSITVVKDLGDEEETASLMKMSLSVNETLNNSYCNSLEHIISALQQKQKYIGFHKC